jgi:hypothetical protein
VILLVHLILLELLHGETLSPEGRHIKTRDIGQSKCLVSVISACSFIAERYLFAGASFSGLGCSNEMLARMQCRNSTRGTAEKVTGYWAKF